jgi:hypothetical protein
MPSNVTVRSKVAEILTLAKSNENTVPDDKSDAQKLNIQMAQYIASLEKELTLLQSSDIGSKESDHRGETDDSPIGASSSQDQDEDLEIQLHPPDEDSDETELLPQQLEALSLHSGGPRFYGRTSHMSLLHTALDMKECSYIRPGIEAPAKIVDGRRSEYWKTSPYNVSGPTTVPLSLLTSEGMALVSRV